MYYFKLPSINNDEEDEYPFYLSNNVWSTLREKLKIDPMISDNDSWIDDSSVINLVGYESLRVGCRLENKEVPIKKEIYEDLIDVRHGLEISYMIMNEISEATQYANDHFNKGKEGKK